MTDISFDAMQQQPLPAAMVTQLLAIEDWVLVKERVAQWLREFPQYRDDLLLTFSALSEQYVSMDMPSDIHWEQSMQQSFNRAFQSLGIQAAVTPPIAAVLTFGQLMQTASLTKMRLSKRVHIGIDVIDKIQQGKIIAASIPLKLIERLGAAFNRTIDDVRNALAATIPAHSISPALRKGEASVPSTESMEQEEFRDAIKDSPNMSNSEKTEWLAL